MSILTQGVSGVSGDHGSVSHTEKRLAKVSVGRRLSVRRTYDGWLICIRERPDRDRSAGCWEQ